MPERLKILARPTMRQANMVLGFSGWMNGGEASTGTVETLAAKLGARPLAEMDPAEFSVLSFPGPMEVAALLRPHVKIEEGLITGFQGPANTFSHCEQANLVLLAGREPNLKWDQYADGLFEVASLCDVSAIYFVGSVAALVPHTRRPRLHASVSDEALKGKLEQYQVRFSNYEGPASFSTYLTCRCAERGLPMVNLVAEVPVYVQGRNFRCIETVVRWLAGALGLQLNLDDLRRHADRLEERLNEAVAKHPELLERIGKLEEDYDNEVFDTQMGDLKDWLEQKGIRLD